MLPTVPYATPPPLTPNAADVAAFALAPISVLAANASATRPRTPPVATPAMAAVVSEGDAPADDSVGPEVDDGDTADAAVGEEDAEGTALGEGDIAGG